MESRLSLIFSARMISCFLENKEVGCQANGTYADVLVPQKLNIKPRRQLEITPVSSVSVIYRIFAVFAEDGMSDVRIAQKGKAARRRHAMRVRNDELLSQCLA